NKIKEIAEFAEKWEHDRDIYLHALEQETIKLSLSIASRILRREAEMDPLFLLGAVRVSLGQLAETTTVQVRVPADDVDLWSETIAHLPNLRVKPAVIADDKMHLGDCVLETDMGTADLAMGSQLKEIARGLLDEASPTDTCLPNDWEETVVK